MFINVGMKTNNIQQDKLHTILKRNDNKEKNTSSANLGQEEKKQSPKKAIKFVHLIGIIIF
ncbi:MAG: hypothetical protein CL609_14730 [Anaerolineaceae bacterium]|nr:hypothetical protein [Anaerolineaceae bacterium]